LANALGQLADDPVVDVADPVAGQDEHVRGVKVGVEVAEHVDLVEHVPVEVANDPVDVVAAILERTQVGVVAFADRRHDLDEGDAADELRRQDPRRRVLPVDPGDLLQSIAPGVLVEHHRLAGLDEVVELVGRPPGELVDHLPAMGRPEGVGPVEDPGERVHQADVGLEDRPDLRPLDLHRDALAGVQCCPVDLADRRRGERRGRERREDLLRPAAQLLADDLADLLVRERPDLVEQLEKLVAVRGRQ
jgi:hypothetical protein